MQRVWPSAPMGITSSPRLAIRPDGTRIAAMNNYGTLAIWDADNGREVRVLPGYRSLIADLAFSGDGGQLATAGGGRGVLLWDAATGELLKTLLEQEVQV